MDNNDLITRQSAINAIENTDCPMSAEEWDELTDAIVAIPAVDAVPWEFLERYADWFCAAVSMPEFIREAKSFYKSTCVAMDGGEIGQRREDSDA